MKKRILLIIIGIMLLLTACKSAEVKIVEQQISSIGNVTEESDLLIQDVRRAYDNLSNKDKRRISNYSVLEEAELAFNTIFSGKVDKMIEAIGPINDDSKVAIDLARSEYDKLTKAQKSIVNNFGNLIAIEKEYDEYIVNRSIETLDALKDISPEDAEAIVLAEKIFDKLTVEQKIRVSKEKGDVAVLIQKAKVQIVEILIKRIAYRRDEPSTDDLIAMISALTAYSELNEDAQSQVTNYRTAERALDAFSSYMQKRAKTDKLFIRDNYIKQSNTVSYDDLMVNTNSYKGQRLSVEIQIIGIKKGGFLQPDSIAAIEIGTENVFELVDNRWFKEPIISVEDTFAIYGTFDGTRTVTVTEEGSGLWGTRFFQNVIDKYEIPIIKFVYTSIDNLGLIATGNPYATDVGMDKKKEELINQLNGMIGKMQ